MCHTRSCVDRTIHSAQPHAHLTRRDGHGSPYTHPHRHTCTHQPTTSQIRHPRHTVSTHSHCSLAQSRCTPRSSQRRFDLRRSQTHHLPAATPAGGLRWPSESCCVTTTSASWRASAAVRPHACALRVYDGNRLACAAPAAAAGEARAASRAQHAVGQPPPFELLPGATAYGEAHWPRCRRRTGRTSPSTWMEGFLFVRSLVPAADKGRRGRGGLGRHGAGRWICRRPAGWWAAGMTTAVTAPALVIGLSARWRVHRLVSGAR